MPLQHISLTDAYYLRQFRIMLCKIHKIGGYIVSRIFHMNKMQPFFLQCPYRSLIRGSIHNQVILTISEKFFRNCIKIMNQEKIISFLKNIACFQESVIFFRENIV